MKMKIDKDLADEFGARYRLELTKRIIKSVDTPMN